MFCEFFYGLLIFMCKQSFELLTFYLIRALIAFVKSNDPIWFGIAYACCMFINGTVQSVLLGKYFHRMFIIGMRVRTALVTAIYKKVVYHIFFFCNQMLTNI